MTRPPYLSGGRTVGAYSFVLSDYFPEWRRFEEICGTMADDECVHGRTPAERIADSTVCDCGENVRYARDA